MNTVCNEDCVTFLGRQPDQVYDMVFADPPFNVGYLYAEYKDDLPESVYLGWSERWMGEVFRTLKDNGTFWLAIGDEYAAELKVAAKRIGFHSRSWVVLFSTFGVNVKDGFTRSHVHLFHFTKHPKNFTFNSDDPRLRQPSARQLIYNDKRANPKGRLPDNTWILRPQDIEDVWTPDKDTWTFPRVCGTFKERCGWHPCQMALSILERVILFSTNPGDLVFDPFVGSGTTLVAAKKHGRRWIGTELTEEYAVKALERIEAQDEEKN
jgi:site-specific DNA-methyltransferase (adenine-specific)